MKIYSCALMALLLLGACATVHPGKMADERKGDDIGGLVISAKELGNPKDEAFSMIALTFENTSGEWVRIDKIDVLIDEESAKTISVVRGKDLVDWASAMEARVKMERQNRDWTKVSLAATAVTALALSDSRSGLGVASAVGLAGVEGWIIGDVISYRKDWAQNPNATPSDNVQTPFSVPGKMFMRRWLLLNKPLDKMVTSIPLAIHTVDGKRQVVTVHL